MFFCQLQTRPLFAAGFSFRSEPQVFGRSEETGDISIADDNRLITDLTPTHLTRYLKLLLPREGLTDAVRRAIDQIEHERVPVMAEPAKDVPSVPPAGTEEVAG